MAYKGKVITNPKTGQEFRFLQTAAETGGKLLEMESTFQPHSKEPLAHYHPAQDEYFVVLQGELTVRVNGSLQTLKKGEQLHIKANMIHAMWNESNETAIANWQVRPALETEYFFETITGIASYQKTNDLGVPALLQTALIANQFSHVFRLTRPTYLVQKILFAMLTPFAYLAGYKPVYKHYLN